MAGFGKAKPIRRKSNQAIASEIKESIRLSLNAYQNGDLKAAKVMLEKIIEASEANSLVFGYLATIEKSLGNKQKAEELFERSLEIDSNNPDILHNYSGLLKETQLAKAIDLSERAVSMSPTNCRYLERNGYLWWKMGKLESALEITLKALEIKPDLIDAQVNLSGIYKDIGNLNQALSASLKAIELKPVEPRAHMNLGIIYRDLGNLDKALAFTLKSIELKPNEPTAHMNLGSIYRDLGKLDQALKCNLKSLEIRDNNPGALDNLKGLIDEITPSRLNAPILLKAYEILINHDDYSHEKLSKIFIYIFLPIINKAEKSNPIISENNNALILLAEDLNIRKSLTLFTPPNQDVERFLMRLRKELLILTCNQKPIPMNLKRLSEALAIQCFLNEYIYSESSEEKELVKQLVNRMTQSQGHLNQYLSIVACYRPIYQLQLNDNWLSNFASSDEGRKVLVETQLKEPQEEEKIKASIKCISKISDTVSIQVKDMYEDNPYPRYRFASYTKKVNRRSISEAIELETTVNNLNFSTEVTSDQSRPKVLIAGCGTGSQVIKASRYRNAHIDAIDLSKSSLAYAIRKANDYGMCNVNFGSLDLLNIDALEKMFDVIECSGVLHHMQNPTQGLSVLIRHLKPGGYIKLGLYSKIAREDIIAARNIIKQRGIKATPEGIREFRAKTLSGEFDELSNLLQSGKDFYSLSTCRDLCFHIQEHRFTTQTLKELLDAEQLIFLGFLLPKGIQEKYQQQFPDDPEMKSLINWGEFEKEHPLTFGRMYQFWACKTSSSDNQETYKKS